MQGSGQKLQLMATCWRRDGYVMTRKKRRGPCHLYEIPEAAQILRMSRAALYLRISSGAIKAQKDGARTYITRAELERYVSSCD
jgi:hypothetical protein